jgi:hypothetical protein
MNISRRSSLINRDTDVSENLKVLKRSLKLTNSNSKDFLLLGEDHSLYYYNIAALEDSNKRDNEEKNVIQISQKIIDALEMYVLNTNKPRKCFIIEYHPLIAKTTGLYQIYNSLKQKYKDNVFSCDFLYLVRAFNIDENKINDPVLIYKNVCQYALSIIEIFKKVFSLNEGTQGNQIKSLHADILKAYNDTAIKIGCTEIDAIDNKTLTVDINNMGNFIKNINLSHSLKRSIRNYLDSEEKKIRQDVKTIDKSNLDTKILVLLSFMYEIGFLLIYLNNVTNYDLFICWSGLKHIMNEANILVQQLGYTINDDNKQGYLNFTFNNECDLNMVANYYNYPSAYTMLTYYINKYNNLPNKEDINKVKEKFRPTDAFEYGSCPIQNDDSFKIVLSENALINFYSIFTEYENDSSYNTKIIKQLQMVFDYNQKQQQIDAVINGSSTYDDIKNHFNNKVLDDNFLKLCKVIEICFNPIGKNPPYNIYNTFSLINKRAAESKNNSLINNLSNIYTIFENKILINDEFKENYSFVFSSIFKLLNKFNIKIFKLIYEQNTKKHYGGKLVKQYKIRSAKKSPMRSAKKSPIRSAKKSPIRSAKKSPIRSAKKSPMRSAKKSPMRSAKKSPKLKM